jgi:F0F1-type ATP synthase assembly protein I
MERKRAYRILLVLVLFLTVLYTLGIVGVIPFRVSYYITIILIFIFIALRMDYHRGRMR